MKAVEEERKLVPERKDIMNGYPAMSVVIDRRWSKRSHEYNVQ